MCLSPRHFLCTQCLQPLQKMLLLSTPVGQTAHGNSPDLCRRSSPVPQIIIFVFPAFNHSPFSFIASSQVKSLLTHYSSNSAIITVISIEISHGISQQNSRDKASSTMMKSSGLSTEPWWTPTLIHFKLSLYPAPTGAWAPGIGIHALDQVHYPLIYTKLPQCPPNDLPGHLAFSRSVKAM